MPLAALHDDIVELTSPARDARMVVSMPGRYVLANKRDVNGDRRQFACRAVNISPLSVTLAVPVKGVMGERVISHFDEFGTLKGRIVRVMDRGFSMTIAATDEERDRFARKIDWLIRNKNDAVADDRKHKRIVPQNPHSTIMLADGSILGCFVIDMSESGIAVSADYVPEIGTPLAIGKAVGRVVRQFREGFAVQFLELQDVKVLEQRLAARH
ncbi:MAG: PilZ domain-containing protein [Pseudorhodoplanes sp.]|nr:PilZ domain-containing protein [Pseudorhodoplanes sp.]